MYCSSKATEMAISVVVLIFITSSHAPAQNPGNSGQPPASISILDSTRDQDGLNGAVRRVKTEAAKLEIKGGVLVEQPRQLVEITTYGLNGKRIENISYPVTSTSTGKEEYKYDKKGNIIEMIMRGDRGAILAKETYDYDFDKLGNWTKMVTNLVVIEAGELKREPVEITYRTFTYYFDENVAKIVQTPTQTTTSAKPSSIGLQPTGTQVSQREPAQIETSEVAPSRVSGVNNAESGPKRIGKREQADNAHQSDPSKSQKTLSVDSSAARTNQPVRSSNPETLKEAKPLSSTNDRASSRAVPPPSESSVKPPPKMEPIREKDVGSTALSNTASSAEDNKDASQQYQAGRKLFDSGDFVGAVNAYLQSLQLEPASAEVRLSLGHAYIKLQRDKEAVKEFTEAVRLNPNGSEAQYGLGLAQYRLGHKKEAADAFKKATAISPDMAKAHYGLALAYQELGKLDLLIEEYRILHSLDRNLAKQLSQAFPAFKLACRVPPYCR